MMELEGGRVAGCMGIRRHEAGDVGQVAYQLHRRRRWRELFGPSSRRYPPYYRPNPASRRYVNHLPLWYAQSHPDQDFAETLAGWLAPPSDRGRRLAPLAALQKRAIV